MSLIAFATVVLRGLFAGKGFHGTLTAGLWSAGAFLVFGWIAGELARRVVEEQALAEFERQRALAATGETAPAEA